MPAATTPDPLASSAASAAPAAPSTEESPAAAAPCPAQIAGATNGVESVLPALCAWMRSAPGFERVDFQVSQPEPLYVAVTAPDEESVTSIELRVAVPREQLSFTVVAEQSRRSAWDIELHSSFGRGVRELRLLDELAREWVLHGVHFLDDGVVIFDASGDTLAVCALERQHCLDVPKRFFPASVRDGLHGNAVSTLSLVDGSQVEIDFEHEQVRFAAFQWRVQPHPPWTFAEPPRLAFAEQPWSNVPRFAEAERTLTQAPWPTVSALSAHAREATPGEADEVLRTREEELTAWQAASVSERPHLSLEAWISPRIYDTSAPRLVEKVDGTARIAVITAYLNVLQLQRIAIADGTNSYATVTRVAPWDPGFSYDMPIDITGLFEARAFAWLQTQAADGGGGPLIWESFLDIFVVHGDELIRQSISIGSASETSACYGVPSVAGRHELLLSAGRGYRRQARGAQPNPDCQAPQRIELR